MFRKDKHHMGYATAYITSSHLDMTSKWPSTYQPNATQLVSHEIPSDRLDDSVTTEIIKSQVSPRHPVGANLFRLGQQTKKKKTVHWPKFTSMQLIMWSKSFERKTCRGGNLSKKDADMSSKLFKTASPMITHTHTLRNSYSTMCIHVHQCALA